jgi:hypothetical protein
VKSIFRKAINSFQFSIQKLRKILVLIRQSIINLNPLISSNISRISVDTQFFWVFIERRNSFSDYYIKFFNKSDHFFKVSWNLNNLLMSFFTETSWLFNLWRLKLYFSCFLNIYKSILYNQQLLISLRLIFIKSSFIKSKGSTSVSWKITDIAFLIS